MRYPNLDEQETGALDGDTNDYEYQQGLYDPEGYSDEEEQ